MGQRRVPPEIARKKLLPIQKLPKQEELSESKYTPKTNWKYVSATKYLTLMDDYIELEKQYQKLERNFQIISGNKIIQIIEQMLSTSD